MDDIVFNTTKIDLKANQIACLEYQQDRLYGEVIQLIPDRQLCWFRPIYLIGSCLTPPHLSNLPEMVAESYPQNDGVLQTKKYSPKTSTTRLTPDLTSWDEAKQMIDLRAGADLLWPAILFRPALDIEVIDFFTKLNEMNPASTERLSNQKYLNSFLHQVWQSHQDKF